MFERFFRKSHRADRIAAKAIADYERSHDEFDVIRRLKQALEIGLEQFPADRAYAYLGAAYDDVKLIDEAERAYEQALRHNPKNSTALSNLGLVYKANGDLQRAEAYLQRAIEAKPKNGFAYNNLGTVYLDQGKLDQALKFLKRATELNPGIDVAFANLARCHAKLGDFAAAQSAFREASKRGYRQLDNLRHELKETQANLPNVYLEREPFLSLAQELLPADAQPLLERALLEPETLCSELSRKGWVFYLSEYVISRAFAWILLCDELVKRHLAVPWANRPAEEWIILLTDTLHNKGLSLPVRDPVELASGIRASLTKERHSVSDGLEDADSNGDVTDREILEIFMQWASAEGNLVFLLLSEGPERDLVCPLDQSAWAALSYPFQQGPDGYGLVQVMGTPSRNALKTLH